MLHILGILKDHTETSQYDTIKSQVIGDYMILKNTKKNKDYVDSGSSVLPSTHHTPLSIFPIFLTSDIDLLDLTKLGKLF